MMLKQKRTWLISGIVLAAAAWLAIPRQTSAPLAVTPVANAQEVKRQPPPAVPQTAYQPKKSVAKVAVPQKSATLPTRKKKIEEPKAAQVKIAQEKLAPKNVKPAPMPSGKVIDPMANRWLADKPTNMRVDKTQEQKPEVKGQTDNSLMLIGVQMHTDKKVSGEVKRGSYYEATPVIYAE
jgi:hypothetical protein